MTIKNKLKIGGILITKRLQLKKKQLKFYHLVKIKKID